MARKGRKYKNNASRKPSGEVRRDVIVANPLVLSRRLAAAKDIRADADNPLSVLFHRNAFATFDDEGKITDDGRDIFDTGSDLAGLYWRLHGKPFARSAGGVHGIDAVDAERALKDERRFTQIVHALDRLGRNTRSIVLDCCAHMITPNPRNVVDLIRGLRKIADLPRPKISREELDKAVSELAA